MKKLLLLALTLFSLVSNAQTNTNSSLPVIIQVKYRNWTPEDYFVMYTSTNGCQLPGYCMNQWSIWEASMGFDGIRGSWCSWGTSGQITLTFTIPDTNRVYRVEWLPFRFSTNHNFIYQGTTYCGPCAQGWSYISPRISSTNSTYTFQSGIVESISSFRVVMQ